MHSGTRDRREMFKSRGPNWKEEVRAQWMLRSQNMRAMGIDNARRSVIQDIQLEEDLRLEQRMQAERYKQYNRRYPRKFSLEHPFCPLCDRELITMKNSRPCGVECGTCEYKSSMMWEDFKRSVSSAVQDHSNRGCQRQAEFIVLDIESNQELLIACDVCELLEGFC